MTDFDPFEQRLATALRSDADSSVGPYDTGAIAQAAIAASGPGASRLPRASSRPRGRSGRGRGITLLAAAALVLIGGALAAGSGILQRLPSLVAPTPAPSSGPVAIASPDETTTPTPSASASPSPAMSLDLSWTQVPLDEEQPRLAWFGDRFVLADAATGSVRTSRDGQAWQAVQVTDLDPHYLSLIRGSFASWQNSSVGWWNPQDGPDYAGKPPITARDIVTTVVPPGAPTSATPFKGRIESMGIGPRGIVAEVHSALDWDAWVTKKLGLKTNNDWTGHVKSVTFENGVLQIKLTNRPGLRVVWADQGFEPGDYQDRGFGWFSADGQHWTEMPPNPNPNENFGSTLPTGGFGHVVGVSDGFIATGAYPDGACADPNGSCSGMWYSPDGLTWRLLGTVPSEPDLVPWSGGVLVVDGAGRFGSWTSAGSSELPMTADSSAHADLRGATAHTGPLGLVSFFGDGQVLVSRDGIDYKIGTVPAEMIQASHGRGGSTAVAVGDQTVLALKWTGGDLAPHVPSLWLGTFEP
jgi:hypothetical protein